MVGVVDVGDHADLAAVVGQALAQDHAAVVLDDGGVDVAVHQDARARGEVGAVALLHQAAVQVQALAAGQAGALARQVQQARDQARDHGLAVGAGDADDGDAAGVAFGEQVVDDGPAHGAGRAVGRLQVHQQAGAGVDFDDGAALLVQRPRDVLGHQVHAGDVQADDSGGQRHGRGDAGVDLVGHVERHVAAALHQHALAVGGHAVGVHALAGDLQARGGIQAHRVQRVILGAAAARVGIDLVVDQLGDGRLAVARDPGRLAGGGGHHAVAHDQQAVLVAQHEALDDDAAAFLDRDGIGRQHFLARGQVGEDAAAVVAVIGLDHHRQADVLGRVPGVLGAVDQAAFRHRHAAGGQQFLGQVLVARDALGDGAGAVGLGGPDAALARAVAELHQVALEQADVGNVAVVGRVHDAGRAGAQAVAVDQRAQARHGGGHVERAVLDAGHDQVAGFFQRGAGDLFLPGAHHDLVDAAGGGFPGLAETAAQAGEVLQFQGDMFKNVAGPGAFLQSHQEAAPHPGLQRCSIRVGSHSVRRS